MKNDKKKIAFIRPKSVPNFNWILADMLQRAFPEYTLEILDLRDFFLKNPLAIIINFIYMWGEFRERIIHGKFKWKEGFYSTTYVFTKTKQWVGKRVNPMDHVFSFQVQSLFDASTKNLPHFIYTDHTHLARLNYPTFDPKSLRSNKWIALERTIYENATFNFVAGRNTVNSLKEHYQIPGNKIECVGAGSSIPLYELENDNYSNKNILFVGVDWERKGGPELISAFSKVLKKHPDAQLTIVGCSPKVKVPNCKIIGKIRIEDVANYYKKASIFCMPTKLEPFGVVFIEAQFYKLPIVSTSLGALPDYVTHLENGYLVEVGDIDGLAEYLTILLDNPQKCRQFGENGYMRARANYAWDVISNKIEKSIRNIIKPD